MTRVVIQTSVRLGALGWFGAFLFIFSPLIGSVVIAHQIEAIQRSLRYLPTFPVNYNEVWATAVISGAVTAAGLVMILVGREYVHDVQSVKPSDGQAQ